MAINLLESACPRKSQGSATHAGNQMLESPQAKGALPNSERTLPTYSPPRTCVSPLPPVAG